MKVTMKPMHEGLIYIATFPTYYEANTVIYYASEILDVYSYLTLADMKDLSGVNTEYCDLKHGWARYDILNDAVIVSKCDGFDLYMPKFDWHDDNKHVSTEECDECERDCPDCDCYACECCEETEESQAEPIDITISFDRYLEHPEIINGVFQALLKDPEKIKDRPVFITIG